ncbi:MAG: DNA topoisomerase IB [Gemmatimonadaceae bacterium]|nr:DNA topoisomerase IB [Gemmatimonadaceae bacterium]
MATSWILRKGTKARGFRYEDAAGRRISDAATLARIDALRVPPAWTDVHLARRARAAIQAWGFDAKGRRQYRYHTEAAERGQLRKYYRVREMGHALPRLRRRVRRDAASPRQDVGTVSAIVVRLISEGFFRPGSERSTEENRTFGITTMRKSHVRVDGDCVYFRYVGKGRVSQRQCVVGRALARAVDRLLESPGRRLFRFQDGAGRWHDLDARDVNRYLRERCGVEYSAKDFRTWGGTLRAATVLAELGAADSATDAKRSVAMAMRLVSAELGNTPAICRKSYVHPIVIAKYLDEGETVAVRGRGAGAGGHTAEELALLEFLDRHFPERRDTPRARERKPAAPRPPAAKRASAKRAPAARKRLTGRRSSR